MQAGAQPELLGLDIETETSDWPGLFLDLDFRAFAQVPDAEQW